jgi:hypothetical protein
LLEHHETASKRRRLRHLHRSLIRRAFLLAKADSVVHDSLMTMTTRSTHSIHCWLRRLVLLFVSCLICCFAISQNLPAVTPPPDGDYPGGNTAEGFDALFNLTTGSYNTAIGWESLASDTTASFNTAVGAGTLLFNTAEENTATGTGALLSNTTGSQNTANGAFALVENTTGMADTAIGDRALEACTTCISNTAIGTFALQANTSSLFNTAVGVGALMANQTSENTAVGHLALGANTTGGSNTAVGVQALSSEVGGFFNAAFGTSALASHTSGDSNTAGGVGALLQLTSGDKNTAIGSNAGSTQTTGSGNVYIGADVAGADGETNHTYVRNINTTSVSGGQTDTVTVDLTTGLLGHLSSSRRHKEQIQPMNDASETLYLLKPVTYRYKKEIDVSRSLDYGLVAEDVATVDPNLVAHNRNGQIETVRYTAINAMLLNEFLKEHRKIEQLEKQIELLTAGLQKVSAQLEATKPTTQVVLKGR